MKPIIMVSLLTLLFISFTIYADDVSVDYFNIGSTQNDFANVTATVTAHANYTYSFAAPYKFYKWNGSNWVYFNNRDYAWDYSYQGGTWSATLKTFNVFGGEDYYGNFNLVTPPGNGQYKVRFEVNLLGIIPGSDYKEVTFTVNDVVAPSAPQNLSAELVPNPGYQTFYVSVTWDKNDEIDLKNYELFRQYNNDPWQKIANLNKNTNSYNDHNLPLALGGDDLIRYKVRAKDYVGNASNYSNTATITGVTIQFKLHDLAMNATLLSPNSLLLKNNYPNPFNPTTTISFYLPTDQNVSLTVYSLTGEKVATLLNGFTEKGVHNLNWNGTNQSGSPVSSGIYVYQLKAGDKRLVRKMLLAK